jgi:hypothetical protein
MNTEEFSEDLIEEMQQKHNLTHGQALDLLQRKKKFEAARGERTNFLTKRYKESRHTQVKILEGGLGHKVRGRKKKR